MAQAILSYIYLHHLTKNIDYEFIKFYELKLKVKCLPWRKKEQGMVRAVARSWEAVAAAAGHGVVPSSVATVPLHSPPHCWRSITMT